MSEKTDNNIYLGIFDEIIKDTSKEISNLKPSEWAEEKRIMTSDVSVLKGKFCFENSPYTREILDCLAPDHPARKIAVQKGAQIGFSVGVIENAIGWIIDQDPGNILFLVGHQDLVKDAGKKIDTMIDSTGIRNRIKSTTKRVRNTKSGDTDGMKEFDGGYLKLGITNHKSLRNISMKYGFIDDFESMKGDTKEAGDTTKMIEQRFASFATTMKLFYISTPELQDNSNIESVYLLGDQRKYHIPCQCCGELIEIIWDGKMIDGELKGGMKWNLDEKGKLNPDSIMYECYLCGEGFDDSDKMDWINEGVWIPTAEPSEPGYYSYQISAMVAPTFMYGWERYVRDYMMACPENMDRDEKKWQTFKNLVLGETYSADKVTIDPNKLQQNIRSYKIGVVPEKLSVADHNGRIVMLTCGIDLNGKEDDARLDYEVIGHAENGATYSITHGSIGTYQRWGRVQYDRKYYTYIHGVDGSVWYDLDELLNHEFELDHGARKMKIVLTGVDSGYMTEYAYQFMDSTNNAVICLKGADDAMSITRQNANLKSYKNSVQMPGRLFLAQNNYSKDVLAGYIGLNWNSRSDAGQPPGYMNFPTPSDGKYLYDNFFAHFAAEEKIVTNDHRFRWQKKKGRVENHLYDCRLYGMIVRDILVDQICKDEKIRNPGWTSFVNHMMNR